MCLLLKKHSSLHHALFESQLHTSIFHVALQQCFNIMFIASFLYILQGGGIWSEVMVAVNFPNIPLYLNNNLGTMKREIGFLIYIATVPVERTFDVPKDC